jgi:hypothetical protein
VAAASANVAQRLEQGVVITRHRLVITGAGLAIIAGDAPAGKQRQRDRRADRSHIGTAGGQVAQTQRLNPDHAHQVDVGIERRAGHAHAGGSRFGPGARGGDIGAAADQVQRQVRGQALRRQRRQARQRDGIAARRWRPDQHRQRMARQRDGFVGGDQIGTRHGDRGFGLALLGTGIQAIEHPLAHQLRGILAQLQGLSAHVTRGGSAGQRGIGIGNAGGDGETRGLRLEPGGLRFGRRGTQGGPVLAEEIQLVTHAERGTAGVVPALGHERGGDAVVVALLGFAGAATGRNGGQERRTTGLRQPRAARSRASA